MIVTSQIKVTRTNVMRAGVWPTIAALIVAAVLIIERMQVDWAASCKLVSNAPQSCQNFYESLFSLLLPSFTFALAHIIGAVGLHAGAGARPALWERVGKFAAFFAISVFPTLGWYLFYVGLAAGFLISITVIGLVVAPLVGAMAAGFASGLLLALAAGPTMRSLDAAGWKRLIWYYGSASALAPVALFGIPLLALTFYGPKQPADQPIALASVIFTGLAAVAFSSSIVWIAAIKAALPPSLWVLQQPAVRSGFAIVAAAAIALVVPVHVLVSSGIKVFPPDGGVLAPVSSFVRGYKPPIATTLEFAGQRYIGPRSAIHERGVTSRGYEFHEKRFEGTPREATYSETRYKTLQQWLVHDPDSALKEMIFITADSGGESVSFYCQRAEPDREYCTVSPELPLLPGTTEKTRLVAYSEGDRYEFIDGFEHASLFIRWDLRQGRVAKTGEPHARHFCRLNIVSVTEAALSVHQVIPCDADWPVEAKRVRAYVESLFAPG